MKDRARKTTTAEHFVNIWLLSDGGLRLGKRYTTLAAALGPPSIQPDKQSQRVCVLKVTTVVELAPLPPDETAKAATP